MEQKTKNLLIYLLEVISEACDECTILEPDTDNPLYDVDLRYCPTFELDSEDIEVIESLSKYEPRLEELLERCKNAKPIVY